MTHIIEKEITNILAAIVVFAALFLAVILTAPIHILQSYTIQTSKTNYTQGEQITLHTSSTKVRKATGSAHRTIECDAGNNKIVDYTVNNSPALGTPGYHANDYNVVIPDNIANLPANCRVVVAIRYDVFHVGNLILRHVTENAVSNDFTIVAR